jgi:hypothetical protein
VKPAKPMKLVAADTNTFRRACTADSELAGEDEAVKT